MIKEWTATWQKDLIEAFPLTGARWRVCLLKREEEELRGSRAKGEDRERVRSMRDRRAETKKPRG